MSAPDRAVGAQLWETEWAAERAAEALRYLGTHYPECLDALRALDEHETAAHEAALLGDREGYLEALRGYMKAGRDAALQIRQGGGLTSSYASENRTAGLSPAGEQAKPEAGRRGSTRGQETSSPLQNLPTVSPNALETARPVKGAS